MLGEANLAGSDFALRVAVKKAVRASSAEPIWLQCSVSLTWGGGNAVFSLHLDLEDLQRLGSALSAIASLETEREDVRTLEGQFGLTFYRAATGAIAVSVELSGTSGAEIEVRLRGASDLPAVERCSAEVISLLQAVSQASL